MNHRGSSKPVARSGAAFLILIVLVLLVVVGATQTLVRSEVTARRSEVERMRVRTMRAAINAATQAAIDSEAPVRLPLLDVPSESIEVSVNEDQSTVTARWLKGEQVIDQMKQKIEKQVESEE
jgi:hypothetical protein